MENEFLSDDEEMQQENGRSDDHDDDDDSSDDDDDDDNDNDHDDYDNHDDDDDDMNYIQESLAREAAVARLTDQRIAEIMSNNWERKVRTLAVNYILTTGEGFQFSRQTMYRSVIYMERYLAEQTIPSGDRCTVRLLAIACLSLSAKSSDEVSDHVPSLSRYPLGNHFIHVEEIRRTELLVLNELNWDMNVVTPFSFTRFFVSRFCRHVAARYLTTINTSDIIMSVLSEVRLMNHRPSVIAAAATLLAVNTNLTGEAMELLINDLPIKGFLQIDDVSHCYYRLRELMNN